MNEIADTLAKKRANTPFIGSEPFCGVNNSFKSAFLREQRGLIEYWRVQTGMRQSKRLIDPERIKIEAILKLSKKHTKLNYLESGDIYPNLLVEIKLSAVQDLLIA